MDSKNVGNSDGLLGCGDFLFDWVVGLTFQIPFYAVPLLLLQFM